MKNEKGRGGAGRFSTRPPSAGDGWQQRQRRRRLAVRFGLGVNRGSIWIRPMENENQRRPLLSLQDLADFSERKLPAAATVRPVFAGADRRSVRSAFVTFPSHEACR